MHLRNYTHNNSTQCFETVNGRFFACLLTCKIDDVYVQSVCVLLQRQDIQAAVRGFLWYLQLRI